MNFVSIKYDEKLPSEAHVILDTSEGVFEFKSNEFEKNWFDCMKKLILDHNEYPTRYSSTVDHFIMDGAPYYSAYLIENGDEFELSYDHKDYKNVEFFVKDGTKPTWVELKTKYNN